MVDSEKSNEYEKDNAKADAIAITSVLIIVVTAVVYWLSRFYREYMRSSSND